MVEGTSYTSVKSVKAVKIVAISQWLEGGSTSSLCFQRGCIGSVFCIAMASKVSSGSEETEGGRYGGAVLCWGHGQGGLSLYGIE